MTGAPAGKEKARATELEERALLSRMHIIPSSFLVAPVVQAA